MLGAEAIGRLSERPRHGPHGILRYRGDQGDDEDPDCDAGGEEVGALGPGDVACMMFGVMNCRAKKPSTTDGTPARISSVGLRTRRTPERAYSER